jgi:general stress protein YciG
MNVAFFVAAANHASPRAKTAAFASASTRFGDLQMASKGQQHGSQNKDRMADMGRKGGQHSHDHGKSSPSRSDDSDKSHSSGSHGSQDDNDRQSERGR